MQLKDTPFVDLMQKRICNVLLIANPYDAFMLEDDGRIDEKIFTEYAKLGLRFPPRFIQVSTEAEARKKMCVQAVKAAAYAGCKILGVKPAVLVQSIPDAKEKSKQISCEIFDMMKTVADEVGIQLAFINTTNLQGFSFGNYCYGSDIKDLLELAQKYDARIIIDPANAYLAHEKVEELIIGAGDKLIGVLLTDIEGAGRRSVIPTTGCVNYVDVSEKLKYACSDAALIAMYTPVYRRYADFIQREGLILAIGLLLRKIVCVFAQKANDTSGRENA